MPPALSCSRTTTTAPSVNRAWRRQRSCRVATSSTGAVCCSGCSVRTRWARAPSAADRCLRTAVAGRTGPLSQRHVRTCRRVVYPCHLLHPCRLRAFTPLPLRIAAMASALSAKLLSRCRCCVFTPLTPTLCRLCSGHFGDLVMLRRPGPCVPSRRPNPSSRCGRRNRWCGTAGRHARAWWRRRQRCRPTQRCRQPQRRCHHRQ